VSCFLLCHRHVSADRPTLVSVSPPDAASRLKPALPMLWRLGFVAIIGNFLNSRFCGWGFSDPVASSILAL
jgi:hypothetical protein